MNWRSRFLAWVTPILLLAQLALAVHQLEHRIAPDVVTTAHECVLCNVNSGAAPPPTPFVILPPDLGHKTLVHAVVDAACCTHVGTPFHSRAPPAFVAV